MWSRFVAGLALAVAFAAGVTGCSSGESGTATGSGSGTTAATGASPASTGQVGSDANFSTVFDEARMRSALPDPQTMGGWVPKNASTRTIESKSPADCASSHDWECGAVARGKVKYEGEDEYADFVIVAFADRKSAQNACDKEAAWSAKYTKIDMPAVGGGPSHAYYRSAGGLNGANLTMCLGTVVATHTLEGGTMDLNTLKTLALTFAERITKTAAS